LMLQNLLVERFKLTYHRESRDLPALSLLIAKKGRKMPEARDGSDASHNVSIMAKIISNRMTMSDLTTLLSRFLRQPVVDATSLSGAYEVNLQWTPDSVVV